MTTRRHLSLALLVCACGLPGAKADPAVERPGWAEIEGGTFRMGAPRTESCRRDEPKPREVTIDHAYEVAPTEVTQAEFQDVMGYNPSFASKCPTCPVDSVSWHEAAAYALHRSERDGLDACYRCEGDKEHTRCVPIVGCEGYRLPTEAEWEYAARAGTKTPTYAGAITSCMSHDDVADEIGWFKSNSEGETHPVAEKAANGWGLYDTAGNVWEWTEGAPGAREQILKGGSWYHNSHHMRAASQLHVRPTRRLSYAGFRLVRTLRRAADR